MHATEIGETAAPPKRPPAHILTLDIPAFDNEMANRFGATTNAAIARVLDMDRTAISKLRRMQTDPSTAFIAACRVKGVDDRKFTKAQPGAEHVALAA